MQVVERCKLEAPLAESYTNKTRKAIVKVLLEWGSCKRGVDKIIRTRIAFVEGAVQPLWDRCGAQLWWEVPPLMLQVIPKGGLVGLGMMELVSCTLQRPVSDHLPLLRDGAGMRSGKTPFTFCGLRRVSRILKRGKQLSFEEEEAKRVAKEDYYRWALLGEVSWRQESREILLKEGLRTPSFFTK
ncbi:hypothetical protein CK203_096971 [Vitis vinifera]|uniref:Uncharacterized protein n=1 Tax=Vitis vinifera TaxID=29760 RepID=A0A438BTB7_VITVI|nr:hypothetical protein CK203_096971 [Vitis vinifera]